jgi:hypothetical protein
MKNNIMIQYGFLFFYYSHHMTFHYGLGICTNNMENLRVVFLLFSLEKEQGIKLIQDFGDFKLVVELIMEDT